jgi:hypothetical protein
LEKRNCCPFGMCGRGKLAGLVLFVITSGQPDDLSAPFTVGRRNFYAIELTVVLHAASICGGRLTGG